jgi:hypothetical protein
VFLEAATRVGFERVSKLERRTAIEYREARTLTGTAAGQTPSVLVLGNSLIYEAMDYPAIQKAAAPEVRVQRFVIEQTHYLDWYYGIRRLVAEGSRPDYMVLCLAPTHLVNNVIRGEYSSYYLFQASDIRSVARDEGYSLTQETGLFAAHYSLYYAGRANLRVFLMNRLDTPYADLLHYFTLNPPKELPSAEIERIVESRLRMLSEAVQGKTHIALLLPPGSMAGEPEIRTAAERVGIPFLTPVHSGEFPPSLYRDGFHVNETGAEKFTMALAPQLKALVANR